LGVALGQARMFIGYMQKYKKLFFGLADLNIGNKAIKE